MSMSNSCENSFLLLLANNTNWANVGDAVGLRGSTTAGNLYASLHTADPGEAGTAVTSESAYTGYTGRIAVIRASGAGGWTVATNTASNTTAFSFGACTASPVNITHGGVCGGLATTGAAELLFSGVAPLTMGVGITPNYAAGALVMSFD